MKPIHSKNYRAICKARTIEVYRQDECVLYEIDAQHEKLIVTKHTQQSPNPLFADLLLLFNSIPIIKIKKMDKTYQCRVLNNYAEETITAISEDQVYSILHDYGFSQKQTKLAINTCNKS